MNWTQILNQGETPNVDFKAACKWDGEDRARLTKAITAMANTRNGGIVLIGINDDRVGGKPVLAGLSTEQLSSFDPTKVLQYVNERFEPDIRLRIEKPVVDGHSLVAIVVQEFEDQPHICTREASYQGKQQFKPGDLLVRTAAVQSTFAGPQELREMLSRAITKKGDHLLEQMRHIMKGIPAPTGSPDWRTVFSEELSEWANAIREMQDLSQHGGWAFSTLPTTAPASLLSHSQLRDATQSSAISLRGWDFPHHQTAKTVNLTDRITGTVSLNNYFERWDFFRRGLFGDFRSYWEDVSIVQKNESPGAELSFISVSYSTAEFVLFTKRLYEVLHYEGDLVLRVQMFGCKNRKLVSKDFSRFLFGDFVCEQDNFTIERTAHTTDLAAGWEEIAANFAQEIFAMFNWSAPDRDMILNDIRKLRDRRA